MNIDELRKHHLYQLLTNGERLFIETYILTGGDPEHAYKTAYGKDKLNGSVARRLAKKLLQREDIIALTNSFFYDDEPSEDEIRKYLWKQSRTAKTDMARKQFLDMYLRVTGLYKDEPVAKPKSKTTEAQPDAGLDELFEKL